METLLRPWWVDKHKHKLSNSAVVTVLQRSPLLFSLQMQGKGSVVMFDGVDKAYSQGVLNWVPLIQAGHWCVHMDQ